MTYRMAVRTKGQNSVVINLSLLATNREVFRNLVLKFHLDRVDVVTDVREASDFAKARIMIYLTSDLPSISVQLSNTLIQL